MVLKLIELPRRLAKNEDFGNPVPRVQFSRELCFSQAPGHRCSFFPQRLCPEDPTPVLSAGQQPLPGHSFHPDVLSSSVRSMGLPWPLDLWPAARLRRPSGPPIQHMENGAHPHSPSQTPPPEGSYPIPLLQGFLQVLLPCPNASPLHCESHALPRPGLCPRCSLCLNLSRQ